MLRHYRFRSLTIIVVTIVTMRIR